MISYEVHKFSDRRWQIAWITDDRRLAIFDAKRMIGRSRYLAVRVVEEKFDQATGGFHATTVFQRSRVSEVPSYAEMKRRARFNDREDYDDSDARSWSSLVSGFTILGAMAAGAAGFVALQWLRSHIGM